MIIHGIAIPDDLINAFNEGEVVIFAGAGVSMQPPSNCPSFVELAKHIAIGTNLILQEKEPIDKFLGKVAARGVNIKKEAISYLQNRQHNNVHEALLNLFSSSEQVKIITTNFDLLFEECAKKEKIELPRIYSAPAMPLGKKFAGLVHLHGDINYPNDLILDDQSFGEAYITDGWAASFMTDVCLNYVTVFIGYSFDDIIMQYFARALHSKSKPRYIITDDKNEKWEHIGFNAIIYPPKRYDLHENFLIELSHILQRDYFAWERVAKDILNNPPQKNPEDTDRIKYIVKNEKYVKIFIEYAKDFEWVTWLYDQGLLNFLWSPHSVLSKSQNMICSWLAQNFSITHITKITTILKDKITFLHPVFCSYASHILNSCKNDIENAILKQWVVLFIDASKHFPIDYSWNILIELGKKTNQLLFIWSHASKSILSASQTYSNSGKSFNLDIQTIENFYLPVEYFSQINFYDYQSIIYKCVQEIHKWRMVRELHSNSTNPFDFESYRISAIENHSQNLSNAATYHVVLLRDTLIRLEKFDKNAFYAWLDILIKDPAVLLKRIAVFSITNAVIVSNKKIQWFLKNVDIDWLYLHHEIYNFIKTCYSSASQYWQKRLLSKVCKKVKNEDNKNYDRRVFSLLSWISEKPDKNINIYLIPIKKRHPEWKLTLYEDFGHYHYTPEIPPFPLSKEEIKNLSKNDFIITIQNNILDNRDLGTLYHILREIIKDDLLWYYKILQELTITKIECSEIKKFFCNEIENLEFSIQLLPDILIQLQKISCIELNTINSEIRFYKKIIKQPNIRKEDKILNIIRKRVIKLSVIIKPDNVKSLLCDEWVTTAINNPWGIITEFFIEDLAEDQKQNIASPQNVPIRYITFFENICAKKDFNGFIGKTILGMQLSWLLYLLPDLVKEKLCPCLNDNQEEGLWEGLLSHFRLTTQLQKVIMPYFQKRINDKLYFSKCSMQNNFIKIYSMILWYFNEKNQLLEFDFPKFYDYLLIENRYIVIKVVKDILRNNSAEFNQDFWHNKVKPFLNNRIKNKPLTLKIEEASEIFELAELMYFAFDEYLDIIEKIETIKISEHSCIIYKLNTDNEFFQKFSHSQIGRFISIMLNHYSPETSWIFHGIDSLFSKIKKHITPELSEKIFNIAKQHGLNLV